MQIVSKNRGSVEISYLNLGMRTHCWNSFCYKLFLIILNSNVIFIKYPVDFAWGRVLLKNATMQAKAADVKKPQHCGVLKTEVTK